MKKYFKIIFCILLDCCAASEVFSQNDTVKKSHQARFISAEIGVFPYKQLDFSIGYGVQKKVNLVVISACFSLESRHLINNGNRRYNLNFYYSDKEKNIIKSRQTGIAVPLIAGIETRGNIRWNIGLGITPYLGLITVTSLNFNEEESKNGFQSGIYTQLIGNTTPIENVARSEYINPAKSGYDVSCNFQTGFSFGNNINKKIDVYFKLSIGLIEQIETKSIGQFGIVSVFDGFPYDSLFLGFRYYF